MKTKLINIVVGVFLFLYAPAFATVYVVNQNHPAANDSGAGTDKQPFKTIGAAAARVKAGDKVLIKAGIYREGIELKVSGIEGLPITFEVVDPGKVVMRGSVPVKGWKRESGNNPIYIYDGWSIYFGRLVVDEMKNNLGDIRKKDARDFPRNQLFCNGEYIEEVFMPDSLKENSFYIDKEKQQIHLWLLKGGNPNKKLIEGSNREFLFNVGKNNYIVLKGIRFEHGANGPQGQQALVQIRGNNCLVENCSMNWSSATGFGLSGKNNIVRRCVFNHNGQQGFNVSASVDCRIEDCESSYNNNFPTKTFRTSWEAGGNKIARSFRLVLERHQAHYNNGDGIWFDISNNECEIKNCLCTYNARSGIFWELSYKVYIHDNVLIGNKSQGILLAESNGPEVERNIMLGNANGMTFRDMLRTTSPAVDAALIRGRELAIWNQNEVIKNNILAYNQNSQVRGSFLNNIERLMPLALQKRQTDSRRIDSMVLAAKDYQAKDDQGQPVGLSLEKLNIKIDHNIYWGGTTLDLYQWADLKFQSLEQINKDLKFETNGKIIDPQFADWKNFDLRVPADSPLLKMGCYPQGSIPGVNLGIIDK